MKANIIHISDLHHGAPDRGVRDAAIINGLAELFAVNSDPECILLVTGDIVFQGQSRSYAAASEFFDRLLQAAPFKKENVLFCPGNHDIVSYGNRYFNDFDAFTFRIRNDDTCCYADKNVTMTEKDGILFVGINSAFRLDHRYGFIPIDELRVKLQERASSHELRIAYFHHHILNISEQDSSAIRNAYEFLLLLDTYGFRSLFHGHQHFSQSFPLGFSRMLSLGVRTVSFSGATTGLNTYEFTDTGTRYKGFAYHADKIGKGSLGGYICVSDFYSEV